MKYVVEYLVNLKFDSQIIREEYTTKEELLENIKWKIEGVKQVRIVRVER